MPGGVTIERESDVVGESSLFLPLLHPAYSLPAHHPSLHLSAEPASLSVVAAHATLTELLLAAARSLRDTADAKAMAQRAQEREAARKQGAAPPSSSTPSASPPPLSRPLGLRLSSGDVRDLSRMRDAVAERSAVDLVGCTSRGAAVRSAVHGELQLQGRQWAMHVLETPIAWGLSSLYIFVAVVFGVPVFLDIRRAIPLPGEGSDGCTTL